MSVREPFIYGCKRAGLFDCGVLMHNLGPTFLGIPTTWLLAAGPTIYLATYHNRRRASYSGRTQARRAFYSAPHHPMRR